MGARGPPNFQELHADYYEDEFFISAGKYEKDTFNSSFHLDFDSGFHGKGTYKLLSGKKAKSFAVYDLKTACEYKTDSINNGRLIITHFDRSKRIVSGKFHFTAVNKNCESDTVRVTQGRFDIQD